MLQYRIKKFIINEPKVYPDVLVENNNNQWKSKMAHYSDPDKYDGRKSKKRE